MKQELYSVLNADKETIWDEFMELKKLTLEIGTIGVTRDT